MRPLLFILITTLASISAHAQFKRADSPPPVAPAPATVSATATAPASPAVAATAKTRKALKKGAPTPADGAAGTTVPAAAVLSEKDRMAKLHVALDALLATAGK